MVKQLTILIVLTIAAVVFAEEGLVGYWNFDTQTGGQYKDASGNRLHATAIGVMKSKDVFKNAASLNNSVIKITNNTLLMPQHAITIIAWIKTDEIQEGNQSIYRKEDGNGRSLLLLKDNATKLTFGIGTSTFAANPPEYHERNIAIDPKKITDGQWHMIGGSYDGTQMSVYLDGMRIDAVPLRGVMSSNGKADAFIGSTNGVVEFFNGEIDEVKLYSIPLSYGDFAEMYDDGIDSKRREAEKEERVKYQKELQAALEREKKYAAYKNLQREAIKKYNESVIKNYFEPLDLEAMASHSLATYMIANSEPLKADPSIMPVHFLYFSLPDQAGPFPFGGWDFGDATSRAVINWPALREMTGDKTTGLKQEEGNKKLVLELLNEKTGLAIALDPHNPHADTMQYCYMWDQSRTLRALVRWYVTEPESREMLKPKIDKYLHSLSDIADIQGVDKKWGKYSGFSNDNFNPDGTFSKSQVGQWMLMRSGLMLEGVVDYVSKTDDPFALDLAKRLAACVAGSHEADNIAPKKADGSTDQTRLSYGFGEDGSYVGHAHTRTSTLIGLIKLAKYLYMNQEELGLDYLELSEKIWSWSFSSGNASKSGFWVEGIGGRTSELCTAVDALEIAALLGSFSEFDDDRFIDYAKYYDDAESIAVNYVARSYFTFTPELKEVLKTHWIDDVDAKMERAIVTEGSFTSACSVADITRPGTDGKRQLIQGGCCMYAGMRGLHAGWEAPMSYKNKILRVNFFLKRNSDFAEMTTTQPKSGMATINIKRTANKMLVRVPLWLKPNEMTLKIGTKTIKADKVLDRNGYADLGTVKAGTKVEVSFPYKKRKVVEKFAGNEYIIEYLGNYLVKIEGASPYMRMWP